MVLGAADPCRTNNTVQQPWYNNSQNLNRAQLQVLCSAQIGNANSDFNVNPNGFTGGGGGLRVEQGNPNLKSEAGSTWTVGTVFTSPFEHPLARRITASVDYYRVEIEDNIGQLALQDVLDACFNADGENPSYSPDDAGGNCAKILRDPFSGALERIRTPYANLGGLKTSGIDLGLNWSGAFEDMGPPMPGRISIGSQSSRTMHYITRRCRPLSRRTLVGYSNLLKRRATTRVSYLAGGFSAGINWRFRSKQQSGSPDQPRAR